MSSTRLDRPARQVRARRAPGAHTGTPAPEQSGYSTADRDRWLAEDPLGKASVRAEFARDRARLIHSAALRRLAAKTQVVAPGTDDFGRNRLTHSLEVAQIGREFGAALGCDADVVDTACLGHDLGHPPFGHNGEQALNEAASGIGGFEGNAQTLRILTRLEPKRVHPDGRPAGLNLTRACLDATTKYPWARGDAPSPSGKFGVYGADLPVFDWMRARAQPGQRCMEAQVMDWADDVAYSVHDVEDGVAAAKIDLAALRSSSEMTSVFEIARRCYAPDLDRADLEAAWQRLLASGHIPAGYRGTRGDLAAVKDMTSKLVGRFVRQVEQATRAAYGPGPLTRYGADLVVPASARAECAVLKAVAAHFVMFVDERVPMLTEQRASLTHLVGAYLDRPQRLDPDLRADFSDATGDGERLRVVIDQVASLTDARAVSLAGAWA